MVRRWRVGDGSRGDGQGMEVGSVDNGDGSQGMVRGWSGMVNAPQYFQGGGLTKKYPKKEIASHFSQNALKPHNT